MNTLLENIEKQLAEGLQEFERLELLDRYNLSTSLINKAITELKEFLLNHEFSDTEEEIAFFKRIRPAVLAQKIKIGLYYNLSVNEPLGTTEIRMQYFEETLKGLQSLFKLNAFYYQYYKNQFTELDHLYFIRESDHSMIPLPEISDLDHSYSTPMSDLYAKFIAYEDANHLILQSLSRLMNGHSHPIQQDTEPDLNWTGDITNLVEIAYGIYLTGQINHGNASLNQIVRWLEKSLKVSLGNIQKKFTDIERRKRLSITRFIDRMKQAIMDKIDKGNL